ncbi:hypothetical protein DNK06_19435 [Pseudomonas daroniae]|uniref:Uncharacterized protein n=1 Tax=Phytopseudomonas daroniae TaxID=2487519 RepID=A0A4Q9QHG5_9GAMM|nr:MULTISPECIES: hypothetical protein [Pseudomonas]TBU74340.1 hypothetical protein DNK06_19435 [Pseudomonas daroniae]TBU85476.1 hypothetical protein DNK31_03820 [Pseudomonas sp. FRB 228]TBU94324.1 hypothetical protein DNJ99_03820 [Pseudomonas daroniae]
MTWLTGRFRQWLEQRRREREPVCTADHITLEDIDTETGNRLLDSLKAEGWQVVAQYSPLAFDKGIDYDSYRLRRGPQELKLEWDNWMEWKLSGSSECVEEIARRFSLRT